MQTGSSTSSPSIGWNILGAIGGVAIGLVIGGLGIAGMSHPDGFGDNHTFSFLDGTIKDMGGWCTVAGIGGTLLGFVMTIHNIAMISQKTKIHSNEPIKARTFELDTPIPVTTQRTPTDPTPTHIKCWNYAKKTDNSSSNALIITDKGDGAHFMINWDYKGQLWTANNKNCFTTFNQEQVDSVLNEMTKTSPIPNDPIA